MTTTGTLTAVAVTLTLWVAAAEPRTQSIEWQIKLLCKDLNEGIDLADCDGDGKLDVIAGRNWYAAPDFTPRPLRTIEDWNGYIQSNGDFAHDVNHDGYPDLIAGSFLPTEVYWYENPGKQALARGAMWTQHLLANTRQTKNENQLFEDLDGDGTPEWIVNSWNRRNPTLVWKITEEERNVETRNGKTSTRRVPAMKGIPIGKDKNGHGMGVGDLNGDGRPDILVGLGWYEQPISNAMLGGWKFHPIPELGAHVSIPVIIRDLDGDGRNDLILGQGHDFGLHWWQQLPPHANGKLKWRAHLIDDKFSQPHCLHMADLDGDGEDELITGKRVFAHNGRDPGGNEPPCLFYYTWDRQKQSFTKHVINEGKVGTGLQIRTGDLDGDSDLDIAVAGKSGTFLLFNQGR